MIYFVISLFVAFAVVLPILLFIFIKNKKILNTLTITLLLAYLIVLSFGVFANINIVGLDVQIDLTPKGEFFKAYNFVYYNFSPINICINLAMFIPIDMSFYLLFEKQKFIKTILIAILFSVLIEFGQFALPVARTVELTDILYNTISAILGFLILWMIDLIKNLAKKRSIN